MGLDNLQFWAAIVTYSKRVFSFGLVFSLGFLEEFLENCIFGQQLSLIMFFISRGEKFIFREAFALSYFRNRSVFVRSQIFRAPPVFARLEKLYIWAAIVTNLGFYFSR